MLRKTGNFSSIDCGNGNYIIYNTLLNQPIFVDKNSFDFFNSINEPINIGDFTEEVDLINYLKEEYLLIVEGFSEADFCKEKNQEYARRIAEGKTIKFIDFRSSEVCNFGCKHCISKEARSGKLMTYELAKNFISHIMPFIVKSNPKLREIDVHYGNAEPLLNFKLIKEIENLFNKGWPGIKRKTSINTNLSLLTLGIAKFLIENNISIYTSLDGEREANDSIRIFKNGSGTYDTIIKKMELLKKAGYPLEGVSVTLTDGNFKYFSSDKFISWCLNNGFKSLAVDFDLINSVAIPVNERIDFLVDTWNKCNDNEIEFFGTWITPFLNLINRSITSKHYAFCKGIHGESISVGPDGNIYICGSSSKKLGHYLDIESLLKEGGVAYEYFTSNLIGNNSICKGCALEGACAGQCRVTCDHSDDKANESCDYYRKLTEKLLISYGEKECF